MRYLSILILILSYLSSLSQNPGRLKLTIEFDENDTSKIQKFDKNGNLVFFKSFPQYGMSQIITYTYTNNRLTESIWAHSKTGFIISEYNYNDALNVKNTYSFTQPNKNNSIDNLMTFQNELDLVSSKGYVQVHMDENKYLNTTEFYRDSLLAKRIEFKPNGDTTMITTYTYENNRLLYQKDFFKYNNHFNEMIYDYDSLGNEIKWTKIFDATDTAYFFTKIYVGKVLVEENEFQKKFLTEKTKYEYLNGMLKSENVYDFANHLKRQKKYYYNENNTLNKVVGYGKKVVYYIY